MSLGPDRRSWYLQGIRRAEQDGLIAYAHNSIDDRFAAADDYGHIRHGDGAPLLLKFTNTRPLSFIARQVLDLYRTSPDLRFLELGPGAGVACATVNRLLPQAKIDTVSLTPLNPYLRFRWDDMYDHITEPVLPEELPVHFYSSCARPFVRNQYIGRFPQQVHPEKRSYHVIYENYGAIFYSFHPNGNDESVEPGRAAIASALSLLRRDGTMLIMASDGFYRMEEALESIAADTDVIVTCKRTTACLFPCIVAKQESPLSLRLRKDKTGLLSKSSERVLRLEYQELEEIIARICAH